MVTHFGEHSLVFVHHSSEIDKHVKDKAQVVEQVDDHLALFKGQIQTVAVHHVDHQVPIIPGPSLFFRIGDRVMAAKAFLLIHLVCFQAIQILFFSRLLDLSNHVGVDRIFARDISKRL